MSHLQQYQLRVPALWIVRSTTLLPLLLHYNIPVDLFTYIEEAGINGDFSDVTGPCTDVRAYEATAPLPRVAVPFSDVAIRLDGEYCIAFIARAVATNTAPLFSFYDAGDNLLGGLTYGSGMITYDLNRDLYEFTVDTQDWQRYQLCSDGSTLTLYQNCVAVSSLSITPITGYNDDEFIYLLTNPDGGLYQVSLNVYQSQRLHF